MSSHRFLHAAAAAAAFLVLPGFVAAQESAAAKPKHPVVCAAGVRMYTNKTQLPAQYDTLTMPRSGPVHVSSEEEAEAAELALRGRAGSVGATGVLVSDERTDNGGGMRLQRSVVAFFAPSDSVRAQQACAKK